MTEASSGAPFSTTVRPAGLLNGLRLPCVHGIEVPELRQSPSFPVAFQHLLQFLRSISEHVFPDAGSNDEEHGSGTTLPSPVFPPPRVLLAAHNGSPDLPGVIRRGACVHMHFVGEVSLAVWLRLSHARERDFAARLQPVCVGWLSLRRYLGRAADVWWRTRGFRWLLQAPVPFAVLQLHRGQGPPCIGRYNGIARGHGTNLCANRPFAFRHPVAVFVWDRR